METPNLSKFRNFRCVSCMIKISWESPFRIAHKQIVKFSQMLVFHLPSEDLTWEYKPYGHR